MEVKNLQVKGKEEVNGNIVKEGVHHIYAENEDLFSAPKQISFSRQDCTSQRNESASADHSFGNKLLICLPLGALIIPAFFILLAYFLGNTLNTMKLPAYHDVPYLSDVGNHTPQSSIFAFGLTLSSFFSVGVIMVRYHQVKSLFLKNDKRTNQIGFVFGILFVIGKLIAASFQFSSVAIVHFVGAGIFIIFATLWAGIQSLISYKNRQSYYGNIVAMSRVVLSIGMFITAVILGTFLSPDLHKYNRAGYSTAQGSEWAWATFKGLFMLTFVEDFWRLQPVYFVRLAENTAQTASQSDLENTFQNPETTK